MNFFRLKGKENDDGACLVWKCPQCEVVKRYHLISGGIQITVVGLGIAGSESFVYDLRCATCKYDLRVPAKELPIVEQCRELTSQLAYGQLSAEAYGAKIKELPARFIKELLALTQEWKCTTCGEENPITFDACWSCQSKQKKAPTLEVSDDAQPLPGFKTHTNPWDV